jgi:hypothetical protein
VSFAQIGEIMPDVVISEAEFAAFASIINAETTPQGRRMIDMWARSADADSLALIATFDLLWK